MSIVFDNHLLNRHIDQTFIKFVLLFFIPIFEVGYAKKFAVEIIGWIASAVVYVFLFLRIVHWFDIQPYALVALATLLIIFIKNHIEHKKIQFLNLLFQIFFFVRIIVILSRPNEVLWWIDQLICFAILIVSVVYLSTHIKKRSIE